MKIAIISPKNRTVYNFRGDLIKEIIKSGHDVIVTGPNNIDVKKIEDLEAKFKKIPLEKNGINIIADIKYLLNLKKLFKKEKPDITLGYTIKPVIYGSIAAKMAKVKNINAMVTGVGYLFTAKSPKAKILRIFALVLYKIGFKCADKIIFQNESDREEFLSYRLLKKENSHIVNGSGVNMDIFSPKPLPSTISFFMLSRVMISKGIREYLAAASSIKTSYPDVKFMLLGACESIQDSLKEEDLAPYIEKGIIEHYGETDNVSKYYEMCSVYVLPSYREGTPRTVLEAMATKRPIITTDVPGCRGTVIDKKTGFLVKVKDVNDLTEKMEWFILNPERIKDMGQASYEHCLDKYDVKKVNKDMLSIMNIK